LQKGKHFMGIFEESSNALKLNGELWEYLLVVYPDESVKEKLAGENNRFYAKYNQVPGAQSDSFILVANFLAKEEMEATLLRWIQNICNLQNGFAVSLNNFSGFPPGNLYLRIQDAAPFQKLAASLKLIDGFIQSNNCPPMILVSRPHLSFAGKLSQPVYENAVKEYAERSFHETFNVDRLILLKRDTLMNSRVVSSFKLPSFLT
jgi:hypothetical protein